MSLNWKEIDLVLSELNLVGSHIQRITQPDFSSLVLSIYRPGDPVDLYISLASGKTRLHRLSHGTKSPAKLQRFAQFLRSRCNGARINAAYQVGEDRIIKIVATAGGTTTILWLRLWGGAANIIATDEGGTILDAFYRRPARGEVTGGTFDPETNPPKKNRDTPGEYEIRELPGSGDFNTRLEAYYREPLPGSDLEGLRGDVLASLERKESSLLSSIERLKRKRREHSDAERNRELGDLLMSNLQSFKEGDRWARIESYYDDNQAVQIELDPTLRPEQNAEAYYEKYKKAKSGWKKLGEEIAELEAELERIREHRALVLSAVETATLRKFSEPRTRSRPGREREAPPGLQFQSGAHRILVGRSAAENDQLLRRFVRGNDLWLHARDYPGAYVFIKTIPGKSVPLEVLLDAGNLALHYSKARTGGQAELYYTQAKYLRRPKQGKKGLVLPTQEKNLFVRHDPKRLDRLFRAREESEMGV